MASYLFENSALKFDVVISANPDPIISSLKDDWDALVNHFAVLAPSEVTHEIIRDRRVVCDHRALSLHDAAQCAFVLELPEGEFQTTVGAWEEAEKRFIRARRERRYLDTVAAWAAKQKSEDRWVPDLDNDFDFARKMMLRAQIDAARILGPTLARRLVHRHPDITGYGCPADRAYHADVFGAFKLTMCLCLDTHLDMDVADEIFAACEAAWETQPFPPKWVAGEEGEYALRTWAGRLYDGRANVVFYRLGAVARGRDVHEVEWQVIDYIDVPADVRAALDEDYGRAYDRYREAVDRETGHTHDQEALPHAV